MSAILTMAQFKLETRRRFFLVGLLLFALAHVAQHDLLIENVDGFDCEICHIEHFPKVLPVSVIVASFPVILAVSYSYLTVVYKRFESGIGSIRSPPVL